MFPLLIAMAAISAVSAINQTNENATDAQKKMLANSDENAKVGLAQQEAERMKQKEESDKQAKVALDDMRMRRQSEERDAALTSQKLGDAYSPLFSGSKPSVRDSLGADPQYSVFMPGSDVQGGYTLGGLAYPRS